MTIPKPLVQINQSFIVLSVIAGLLISPAILLLPFAVGVYTLITRKNPVILAAKPLLKKPANQYTQEDRDQQLFNQWIATVCLGLALVFFTVGFNGIALFFSIMVMAAAALALMGYCIGCTIRYRLMMMKHNRARTN
ncbi:DUF4395 domain-containing protein [Planococcus salinarum]|uniref:DUF4395 domain-containing protein n=1 Tax=Planococcus salinarum TaxID=622695 RepID=UPI000E3BE59E|nr:DUF4395 domain-containing protein [Planococcus salinarum]TAA72407.1 DUF4395 domain-containing protein [Planococcus salinarum]